MLSAARDIAFSLFFVFGLYSALAEFRRLAHRLLRRVATIDKKRR